MTSKLIRLPREGLVGPGEARDLVETSHDVEGHGLPSPTQPVDFSKLRGGHGGEAIPRDGDEGDVEGRPPA